MQFLLNNRVIVPEYERVVVCLVLNDSEFSVHVVLHLVIISVQMVGRDIHQDGYIGVELIHIIKLEAAQLYDVIVVVALCHL